MHKNISIGLLISGLIVILASFLASSFPDGLEWNAEKLGFIEKASEPIFNVMPDYTVPLIQNNTLSTILAGIIGLFIVYLFTKVTFDILK